MPTGYTYFIEEGEITNPKDFILLCTRNFGCCIHLRDTHLGLPPDKLPQTDYYKNRIQETEKEIERFENMSDKEFSQEMEKEYKSYEESQRKYIEKSLKNNSIYEKFIDTIKRWNISSEYESLKRFVLEQLDMSIERNLDYNEKYILEYKKKSIETTKEKYIDNLREELKKQKQYKKEDDERYQQRQNYLDGLRKELEKLEGVVL